MSSDPVVILSARRSPVGSFQGVLAPATGPQLGAVAIKAALADSGLTAEDDGSTQTTAHLLQERIQLRGLLAPPDQHVSP